MKIQELVPELLVEDMTKTLQFYQKIIGFKVEIAFPEKKPIFVQIKKESARIMLYLRSDFQKEIAKLKKIKMGGSTLLYFRAKKIKDFYQKIKPKVKVIQPLHKTDYGTIEFTIEDGNGYLLVFSEKEITLSG